VHAARTGDVAGAEDVLSDAFAAALGEWPNNGVPDNPSGWLLTVAWWKHIDAAGRTRTRYQAAGPDVRPCAADAVNCVRLDAATIAAAFLTAPRP
jgi:RNA polymerase sigma-70 factor (ECF subfamily)